MALQFGLTLSFGKCGGCKKYVPVLLFTKSHDIHITSQFSIISIIDRCKSFGANESFFHTHYVKRKSHMCAWCNFYSR